VICISKVMLKEKKLAQDFALFEVLIGKILKNIVYIPIDLLSLLIEFQKVNFQSLFF